MNDEWLPMPRYKLRKNMVKAILKNEVVKNKTCLEIGYGAGDMLILFSTMGLRTYGYDFSESARHIAKSRIEGVPDRLKRRITLLGGVSEIQKNAYDYLMAFEVLEHIQDDVEALKTFNMYLRKNGKIVFSVPAHMSKWGANDISTGHYRRYEKAELFKKLQDSEFTVRFILNYAYPLSLALDPLLHRSSAQGIEAKGKMRREDLSKESGIRRKNNFFNHIVSSDIVLFPFYFLQRFFLNKELGSAYLVFAEKNN